jgi:hypothetical protein
MSVRKSGGKRSLEKLVNRWENNIKMGLKKIKYESVDWNYLA